MADKRPVYRDATTGQLSELAPPNTIPADVLPPSSGATFAYFTGG